METEPLCLLIWLGRHDGDHGSKKNTRLVIFPKCLMFMRTGQYEFAGDIFHRGDKVSQGHYTPVCRIERSEGVSALFDDEWDFSEKEGRQMRDGYVLLYTRSTFGGKQGEEGIPVDLPYSVGVSMNEFSKGRQACAVDNAAAFQGRNVTRARSNDRSEHAQTKTTRARVDVEDVSL